MTNTFHRNDATFSQVAFSDVSGSTTVTIGSTVTISSTQITATAWTTYNPNITAQSGTFTTVSGAGRYQQFGKTVAIFIQVTVTTSGTAGSAVLADLPIAATSHSVLAGRENAITGSMLQAVLTSSSAAIVKYDNSAPPISSGSILIVSGVYESV